MIKESHKERTFEAYKQYIKDVSKAFKWFIRELKKRAKEHDYIKLTEIDMFHKDFVEGFKEQNWYTLHKQKERHHTNEPDGRRGDVDVFDFVEFIIDGVMAGIGRSSGYKMFDLDYELYKYIYENTVRKLINNIEDYNEN